MLQQYTCRIHKAVPYYILPFFASLVNISINSCYFAHKIVKLIQKIYYLKGNRYEQKVANILLDDFRTTKIGKITLEKAK